MKKVNGLKYNRSEFKGYKNTLVSLFEKDGVEHKLDIYTTDDDIENVIIVLKSDMKKGVKFIKAYNWMTKEQCDKNMEWLEQTLSGI